MDRAFAEIAAAGYEGVELFDGNFLEYSAAEMRKLLADNGLSLVAAYAGANFIFDDVLPEELQRIVQSADRLAELGGEHLVVGGGASATTAPSTPTTTALVRRSTGSTTSVRAVVSRPIITRTFRPLSKGRKTSAGSSS